MKKEKRVLIPLLFVVCGSTLLSACNKETSSSSTNISSSVINTESSINSSSSSSTNTSISTSSSKHEHIFADSWSKNEDGHYKECICHPSEIIVLDHEDNDKDGICNVCDYVIEEVKTYTVIVQDHLNNAIEGAEVKFTNLDEKVKVTTNAEGEASADFIYVEEVKAIILSVPEGYVLSNEINEVILEPNEIVYISNVDKILTYTIYTKKENGESLRNAKVELKKNEQLIDSKVSKEDGVVIFNVKEDEYEVEITHLNEAYTLKDDNKIVLNKDNTTYNAVFVESEESILYFIYFYDTEGNILTEGNVFIFDEYGEFQGLLSIIHLGYCATFISNDDYYFSVFTSDGKNQVVEVKKDDPNIIHVTIDANEGIGLNEENPVLIYNLLDIPLNDECKLIYNWDYEFEANETLYVRAPKALGKYFSIDGSKFTVSYNDKELVPNDSNKIETYFEDVEYGQDVILKITAKEKAVEDIEYVDSSNSSNY